MEATRPQEEIKMITFASVRGNPAVAEYIARADESLAALGYTEHSFAHVTRVAETARYILSTLGYPEHDVELAQIAGYLHDIGNLVNRIDHAQSGAVMAFRLLDNMGASPDEIATIVSAIGNHDESTAVPVKPGGRRADSRGQDGRAAHARAQSGHDQV